MVKIAGAKVSTFGGSKSLGEVLKGKTLSSGGIMFGGDGPQIISAVHLNPGEFWTGSQVGMTFTGYADEFTMLPEWLGQLDNFYLGSLIKGNSIASLEMAPLSERLGEYQSRNISASISLPLKTVSGVYNPTELRTSEFYSRLLLANGMQDPQRSSYSYTIQEFTYYDELKTVFGSNVKVNALFFSSGSTSTNGALKISKSTGLVAKFTQKNFSLNMDVPIQGELYDNLNLAALGNQWPAYISSITYGSTGVLVIESDEDSEKVNSTYSKAFSVLGGLVSGGNDLTESEKGTISKSTMRIYFIGPNGVEAVKSIFSFEELAAYIKKGTSFSPQSPGVPISFKMKSLPDHKTLKNDFVIDVPIKPFYVKAEFTAKDPRPESCPCHNLNLTFFADERGKVPIKISKEVPIYVNTKFVRIEREGSPREGFTLTRIYESEPHFSPDLSNKITINNVFLIINDVVPSQNYSILK
ncbi:thiol-activated cytolysin family protein [Pedobacter roseus]|uniref:Thiol-activated cytolysin family protein n=1 Tax=Pedobacter roseus TaxID=336820 RepID=A0A7G9QHG6_9SPHI|nr:thiol-activated cytolysin family protein [Pedobacter roseus]QNN42791.1 thiol-activated cytolysin family protein [Pedobacter roseus]